MKRIILFALLQISLSIPCYYLHAGELTPPETVGACCLNSELGLCQEATLKECFTDSLGFGWSDELTCDTDTCVPDPEGDGDCCFEHLTKACENLSCSQSICSFDPYCCIFEWDDICVGEAQQSCGDLCPQSPIVLVPTLGDSGIIITLLLLGFSSIIYLNRRNEQPGFK